MLCDAPRLHPVRLSPAHHQCLRVIGASLESKLRPPCRWPEGSHISQADKRNWSASYRLVKAIIVGGTVVVAIRIAVVARGVIVTIRPAQHRACDQACRDPGSDTAATVATAAKAPAREVSPAAMKTSTMETSATVTASCERRRCRRE